MGSFLESFRFLADKGFFCLKKNNFSIIETTVNGNESCVLRSCSGYSIFWCKCVSGKNRVLVAVSKYIEK